MSVDHSQKHHDYHLVDPSPWPLAGALSAVTMFVGLVLTMHGKPHASWVLVAGFLGVLSVMFVWWRDVVGEGLQGGHHSHVVRQGLRLGMALFLLSEVMFFFAFFWAFFKASVAPALVFEGNHIFDSAVAVISGTWPPSGIKTFDAWDLPFINTLILLLSGCTVTWAHHALIHDNRRDVIRGLACTVALGVIFTTLQAVEYLHATFCMNGLFDAFMAKLGLHHQGAALDCSIGASHIYPSSFFMATGFHGAHVIIGTTFLAICLIRAAKGQFSPRGHLGFEFAAWYWHFVDVVWIFLFVFLYVLGA
jgi:cytochrome c oxidase subunit III